MHDFGGSGPVLVLSHATGLCGGVWLPLATHLANHYHCFALDYRGHGHTVTPDSTTMAWTGMANDLVAVIEACGGGEPVLVAGHSMGGAAIVLAERLRPGLIAKAWGFEPILFDVDAVPASESGQPNLMVEAARRRRATFGSRDEVYERYSTKPPLDSLDPCALRAYVDFGFRDLPDGTVTLRCTPQREAETFENSRSGAFAAAADLGFDYLVAVSGDGMPPAIMAETAANTHERMSLVHYRDLTHFGPLEQPERVAVDLLRWFQAD